MAEPIARAIVRRIESDLRDRPGIGEVWDSLGDELQQTIMDHWAHYADAEIKLGISRLLDGEAPPVYPIALHRG